MRMFFVAVGVLAWIWALAVLWIFAENGGPLTVIAAGVFAVVAVVALGCERILKVLEDIRDASISAPNSALSSAPGAVPQNRAAETQQLPIAPAGIAG